MFTNTSDIWLAAFNSALAGGCGGQAHEAADYAVDEHRKRFVEHELLECYVVREDGPLALGKKKDDSAG